MDIKKTIKEIDNAVATELAKNDQQWKEAEERFEIIRSISDGKTVCDGRILDEELQERYKKMCFELVITEILFRKINRQCDEIKTTLGNLLKHPEINDD